MERYKRKGPRGPKGPRGEGPGEWGQRGGGPRGAGPRGVGAGHVGSRRPLQNTVSLLVSFDIKRQCSFPTSQAITTNMLERWYLMC